MSLDEQTQRNDRNREGQRALYGDARAEQLRVPPQAIDAEQAVLGGLMLVPRAWDEIADVLTEADFYHRAHQLIFRSIKSLHDKGQPHDFVTMGEFFESNGLADEVSISYLIDLDRNTPSAANIRAYADIVADKARLRQVIDVGTGLVNAGFQPEGRGSVEIIGQAQTQIAGLLNSQPCELESVIPVMQRVFDRLLERERRGAGIDGLPTGLADLDALLNGLKGGQLILLAARPKAGKTTLAQNIAEHVALDCGKAVAVFSFEMQPEELGDRMLSSLGNVDAGRVRRGELDDMDWSQVQAAMVRLRSAQIYVSRPRVARVEHVVAQVRRQHAKKPLGLVVIDYLQLMQTSGDNRAQAIGDITRALKMMAGELNVPVLLLSQLNRDLEKRDDKRPRPADLRDSGSIEQDADAVIFIYRDEVYDKASRYAGTAEIIVALQRNGPSDTVRVQYRPDRFRFENLPHDWEPAPLPPKADAKRKPGFGGSSAKDAAAGDA